LDHSVQYNAERERSGDCAVNAKLLIRTSAVVRSISQPTTDN